MNRRSFLKTVAVSSAAATFPSIIRAQALGLGGATAPSARLNIGCIGVGGQGRAIMTNALASSAARVVAVCDVDKKHLAQARRMVEESYAGEKRSGDYKGCDEYGDMRELLARADIDAVLVASPEHWHAIHVVHAARAGKHIYCEKPSGASIPETRAMLNAVQLCGIVCQIGSQQRSSTEFLRAIDLARGGYLGEIKRVRVGLPADMNKRPEQVQPGFPEPVPPELDYETWLGPAEALPYCKARAHYNWRWNFAFGGGRLTDWVGHHFDSAALAMRVNNMMPAAIRAAKARFLDDSPLYNTAADYSFEAHYANGVIIEVSSAIREGVHIDGSEGSVYVNRGVVEYSAPHLRRIQIPTQKLSAPPGGARGHMNNFIECALTGATPRAPMGDAHCVTAAAHLANIAFRAGRSELRFDPVAEQLVDAPDAVRYFQRSMRAPWTLSA